MSGSKTVAAAGGLMALLLSAGAASAAEACKLGTEYQVTSVAAYKRPVETGGYGGTVTPVLRGAEIRVAAQPGLTAEWMERKLEAQVATGECTFGVTRANVDVVSEGDNFIVRVTNREEIGALNRPTAADERAAAEILSRASELPPR